MTAKGIVESLNKETLQAIARLVNLIGTPVIIAIGGIFINKANIVIENQEKMFSTQAQHAEILKRDSTDLVRLFRNDQLLNVKQNASISALKINTKVGAEFSRDYMDKYDELFNENKFLNP